MLACTVARIALELDETVQVERIYQAVLGNRGSVYRALGRNAEALADFNRALELNPELDWVVEERNQLQP